MDVTLPEPGNTGNRLLDTLSPATVERLVAASSHVSLPLGLTLFERDVRPRYVYFLTSGIGSIVFSSERGNSVELSTEGKEGLLGWSFLLGPMTSGSDCNVQVPAGGFRIPLQAMQREFDEDVEVRQRVLEYAQHQLSVANQVLACNRLHRVEARFSRWLLMVADRIESDDLPMTQEFMSLMLGTRRTTVAEVAAELARAGGVEGRRGGLRIANREALHARVCECYPILHDRFVRLYGQSARFGELATKVNGGGERERG